MGAAEPLPSWTVTINTLLLLGSFVRLEINSTGNSLTGLGWLKFGLEIHKIAAPS
jgi:hypothetical protein